MLADVAPLVPMVSEPPRLTVSGTARGGADGPVADLRLVGGRGGQVEDGRPPETFIIARSPTTAVYVAVFVAVGVSATAAGSPVTVDAVCVPVWLARWMANACAVVAAPAASKADVACAAAVPSVGLPDRSA
jgi:hypothetical protein